MAGKRKNIIMDMYASLSRELGPSAWWPAETPFEVVVGAVLTQNTSWSNVEKALHNLKAEGLLEGEAMLALPDEKLAELIRPAGYFRLKAGRLKNVLRFLGEECAFDLDELARRDPAELRPRLLRVRGVGPETADAILLYALRLPVFVVDAYTVRILGRHKLIYEDADYAAVQERITDALPVDVDLYNEYHALIVRAAKKWCRKSDPDCENCPLGVFLE